MTDEQTKSIEALEIFGFDRNVAKKMIRMGELTIPLTDNVRRNAVILARYISIDTITSDQSWKAVLFLKRDYHTNEQMTIVPDRYAFTEDQTHDYYEKVLDWEITSDLKEELDDALKLIMIYLMDLIRSYPPQRSYYDGIEKAYRQLGFEEEVHTILEPALDRAWKRERKG